MRNPGIEMCGTVLHVYFYLLAPPDVVVVQWEVWEVLDKSVISLVLLPVHLRLLRVLSFKRLQKSYKKSFLKKRPWILSAPPFSLNY